MLAVLPPFIRTWQTESAHDVKVVPLLVVFVCAGVWTVDGVSQGVEDAWLIDGVPLLLATFVLILKCVELRGAE